MIVKTALSRKELDRILEELERIIELRPISRDALQQRIEHLSGSTEAEISALLDGLRRGTYDHPSGWIQALRHLQANNCILYVAPSLAKSGWKSTFRSPRVRDSLLRIGTGLLLLAVFLFVTSPALKSCLLFLAAAVSLMGAFVLITISLPTLSENNAKRLAGAVAVLIASIYYIVTGSNLPLIAFSWIMLLFGVSAFIATAQRLFLDGLVFRLLLDDFHQDAPNDIPMPLVYVLAQPGWGVYHSNRLSAQLAQSLSRYQFRPNEAPQILSQGKRPIRELSPRLKRFSQSGILCHFLISDSMRRFPLAFRQWIERNSAALVVVRLPAGFLPEDEEQRFEEQAVQSFLTSPGPTFDFRVDPRVRHDMTGAPSADLLSSAADVSVAMGGPAKAATMGRVIAPLVQRLSVTAIPMHWADFRLPVALARLKEKWREAIGPVADVYLRLRLAQSDVERFLILLEGIEVLMKVSAIILIAATWRSGQACPCKNIDKRRLALGDWRELLTEVVRESSETDVLSKTIRDFWSSPTSMTQIDLIDLVSSAVGILSKEGVKEYAQQLDWLHWLVSLRNATRGHGVVEETGVAPFWESLYNVFLEMSQGLEGLVFSSRLLLRSHGGVLSLQGWLRHGFRSGAGARVSENVSSIQSVHLVFGEEKELELSPLLLAVRNDVLFWDGWTRPGDTFQTLSYATGSRQDVKVLAGDQVDVATLWSKREVGELKLDTPEEKAPT